MSNSYKYLGALINYEPIGGAFNYYVIIFTQKDDRVLIEIFDTWFITSEKEYHEKLITAKDIFFKEEIRDYIKPYTSTMLPHNDLCILLNQEKIKEYENIIDNLIFRGGEIK